MNKAANVMEQQVVNLIHVNVNKATFQMAHHVFKQQHSPEQWHTPLDPVVTNGDLRVHFGSQSLDEAQFQSRFKRRNLMRNHCFSDHPVKRTERVRQTVLVLLKKFV